MSKERDDDARERHREYHAKAAEDDSDERYRHEDDEWCATRAARSRCGIGGRSLFVSVIDQPSTTGTVATMKS